MSQKYIVHAAALMVASVASTNLAFSLNLFSFSNPKAEVERYLRIIEAKEKRDNLLRKIQEASKNPEIINAYQEVNKLQLEIQASQAKIEEAKNEALEGTNQAIRFLEDQLKRRNEDRKQIEDSIKSLKATNSSILTLNKYLASYFGGLLAIGKKLTSAAEEGAQVSLQDLDTQIEKLKVSIIKEQENLQKKLDIKSGFFGRGPSPNDMIQPNVKKIQEIEQKIFLIQDKLKTLQKRFIINEYSDQAQKLIAQLTKDVKDAKCPLIKSIANVSDDNIKECLRLSLSKVSKVTENPACSKLKKTEGKKITLILGATYNQIIKCAQGYLAAEKK